MHLRNTLAAKMRKHSCWSNKSKGLSWETFVFPTKPVGKFINGWDEDREMTQRGLCSNTPTVPMTNILGAKKNRSSALIHQHLEKINNYCILQQQYPLLLWSWIAKDEARPWSSQTPYAETATKNTYIALTTIWLPVENFEVCWFLYTTESDLGLVMMLIEFFLPDLFLWLAK